MLTPAPASTAGLESEGAEAGGSARSADFLDSTACLSDISCSAQTAAIQNASRGIGRIAFISAKRIYVCTGGLLNDAESSGTPYFLTAHHCLGNQAEVSSMQVAWDYRTPGCGQSPPLPTDLEKSRGGHLLSTGDFGISDSTLVRLNQIPTGRFFFGWTTQDPSTSTLLQRVSSPHVLARVAGIQATVLSQTGGPWDPR